MCDVSCICKDNTNGLIPITVMHSTILQKSLNTFEGSDHRRITTSFGVYDRGFPCIQAHHGKNGPRGNHHGFGSVGVVLLGRHLAQATSRALCDVLRPTTHIFAPQPAILIWEISLFSRPRVDNCSAASTNDVCVRQNAKPITLAPSKAATPAAAGLVADLRATPTAADTPTTMTHSSTSFDSLAFWPSERLHAVAGSLVGRLWHDGSLGRIPDSSAVWWWMEVANEANMGFHSKLRCYPCELMIAVHAEMDQVRRSETHCTARCTTSLPTHH